MLFGNPKCAGGDYSAIHTYSRKTNSEEKARDVAAVLGTEKCIQFLAALAVLHYDDLKKRMNFTRMI